jgi:glycerol-3-phosphate dehydrogenase
MRRDLEPLASSAFDLLVVGGGIHGACAAWEGARRGLRVALIEARDFGGATSANSLRTLHGGLRHLQRLDFKRMRESIRERREWLRVAPHLARPLRFVLATHGHGVRGPAVMRAALWINDRVSFDRNRGLPEDRRLPRGTLLREPLARAALAGLALPGCNGAAAWHDAVCLDTERLLLTVIAAAAAAGAAVANYVRANGILAHEGRIRGVRARDELTGRPLEITARSVVNAAGPALEDWLPAGAAGPAAPLYRASKAFNLLTRALPFAEGIGISVPEKRGLESAAARARASTYFILPWNGYSLIGTRHLRCDPCTRAASVSGEEVSAFLDHLNSRLGVHRLTGADVHGVFCGLLPEEEGNDSAHVALERDPQLIDHARTGLAGLVSVVGVKWTTARAVAERAVRIACHELGASLERDSRAPALNRAAPGVGASAPQALPRIDRPIAAHLGEKYGAACHRLLALIAAEPALSARIVPDLPVVLAEVVYAAREEMAQRLADIVMRRTALYLSRALDRQALAACATILARELRWGARKSGAELDDAARELSAFRGPLAADPTPVAA